MKEIMEYSFSKAEYEILSTLALNLLQDFELLDVKDCYLKSRYHDRLRELYNVIHGIEGDQDARV